MKKILLGVLVLTLMSGVAFAEKKATKESAQALVQKAVAYVKEVGPEKALEEFSNPAGKFVDGEDYLSIYSPEGVVLGHGANKALIGKNIKDLKDSQGKLFIQEFITKADKPGATGWVEYYWTNPSSKKIEPKESYFERVGDLIIQAGYYK